LFKLLVPDVAPPLTDAADVLSETSDANFACQQVFLLTKQLEQQNMGRALNQTSTNFIKNK
jgi:hypothetical protein